MRKINTFTLNITVAILDFLYQGRHFQRFWVLEEIARAPYFAFLSVLHLRESLGLRGQWHTYLMKQHFEQSVNETEHLKSWNLGAVMLIGLIAFLPDTSYLSIIGSTWFIIGYLLALLTISPTK